MVGDTAPPVDVAKDWLTRTTRIVMLAMAVVMVCIAVVAVIVVLNERSTQINADTNASSLKSVTDSLEIVTEQLDSVTDQNAELQAQLNCRLIPNFEADKAEATLAITTARGLAAVGQGDEVTLSTLTQDLLTNASALESALDLRELSIEECAKDPSWVPPSTTLGGS